MMAQESDWVGLLRGQRRSGLQRATYLKSVEERASDGGSGAFLAKDASGLKWWVKPLNNKHGALTVVTEFIVGSVGALIDAPVCQSRIMMITSDLVGWEFVSNRRLIAGLAHGSLSIGTKTRAIRNLMHRDLDDNAVRHVGVIALYDWCYGNDFQWLYDPTDDKKVYSHDHGWYLGSKRGKWTESTLRTKVDMWRRLRVSRAGLDPIEIDRIATALSGLTRQDLVDVLCKVPKEWPVTDSALECVGWFLESRASQAAQRLRHHWR